MTFKETDFPSIFKFLKSILREESDPVLIKDILQQLIKLYEDVPLYPGITHMCLGGITKSLPAREVLVGQRIYIRNKGDCYIGTVESKDSDGVTLKHVKIVTSEDELEVGFKEMEKVTVLNEKILEELWPSLVFKKEVER
ncbi:hypothetical protein HYY75_03980 [bacterium]|nr:hypothetical protein [bacterium]